MRVDLKKIYETNNSTSGVQVWCEGGEEWSLERRAVHCMFNCSDC